MMKRAGFTLVEILTSVAIMALLAAVILGLASHAQRTAGRRKAEAEITELKSFITDYQVRNGQVPKDMTSLSNALKSAATDVNYALKLNTHSLTNLLDPWSEPYEYERSEYSTVIYYVWSYAGEKKDDMSKRDSWIGNPPPAK